jgi:hypothetical protein
LGTGSSKQLFFVPKTMKQDYFDLDRYYEITLSPDGDDFNCFKACFAQLEKTDRFVVFEDQVHDFLGDWSYATFTVDGHLVLLLYWHWFGVELKMEKNLDVHFYNYINRVAEQLKAFTKK